MYKALINIGDFKKGEEVPEELALVWAQMYLVSPVEKVVKTLPVEKVVKTEKTVDKKEFSKKKIPVINPMLDDYLARNENVVCKNIQRDDLGEITLNALLKLEIGNKNRTKVKKHLNKKLEAI